MAGRLAEPSTVFSREEKKRKGGKQDFEEAFQGARYVAILVVCGGGGWPLSNLLDKRAIDSFVLNLEWPILAWGIDKAVEE